MAITNKYFIVNLPEQAMENILSHCVGTAETSRQNIAGNKTVVKLPVGADVPQILNAFTEYSHAEILPIMQTAEWSEDIG